MKTVPRIAGGIRRHDAEGAELGAQVAFVGEGATLVRVP
jgi:hypothetical protein